MDYRQNYEYWLNAPELDEASRAELQAIADDEQELKSRFGSALSFGTAGLRGVMAAGSNRMNVYTVSQATQGFAEYILANGGQERSVVIAYDCRNNSKLFAERAACVMAANGIQTYLFPELRPTPLLSFSVLHLGCIAGINITASHNPAQYNGYKAYWEDGAQLSPETADGVSACIRKTDLFCGVKSLSLEEGIASGRIVMLGEEVDKAYLKAVREQSVDEGLIRRASDVLEVVYTPLYGAGAVLVPRILRESGLKKLFIVNEELGPDGNFPGMKNPNPEYPEVFARGIALANEKKADLIIATDPDSDRMGVTVRKTDGSFVTLNGNQIGALLLHFVINALKSRNALPSDAYAIKTLVSTPLTDAICEKNGVSLNVVLTGFKFIGEVIKNHLEAGKGTFLFGYEESYGYLKGTYARDKDAVVASMLVTEAAAFYMLQGKTLYDALCDLYAEYGYYYEITESVMMPGHDGADRIRAILGRLRADLPEQLGGERVVFHIDCKSGRSTDRLTGEEKDVDFPTSDVLYFRTEKNNVVIIRPSGTEPKYKIYFMVNGKNEEEAKATVARFKLTTDTWR